MRRTPRRPINWSRIGKWVGIGVLFAGALAAAHSLSSKRSYPKLQAPAQVAPTTPSHPTHSQPKNGKVTESTPRDKR